MPSLADLFNPSFLMFLGILVLVASLLVVYFESKNREQNHKINSMFSIVSSLAEEVHNLKLGLSQVSFSGGNKDFIPHNFTEDENLVKPNNLNNLNNLNLIPVSDDDNSDEESEESEELDLESVVSSSSSEDLNINDLDDHDDKSINSDKNKIKILKINMPENFENENSSNENIELDEMGDYEISDSESLSSKSNEHVDNLLLLKNIQNNDIENDNLEVENDNLEIENDNLENSLENINSNILDISSSELKTININLEDSNNEIIDYKKLPLPKLRSIVLEKGLINDSSKLKKNELLKLLGIE
jgi:hypothetical protein